MEDEHAPDDHGIFSAIVSSSNNADDVDGHPHDEDDADIVYLSKSMLDDEQQQQQQLQHHQQQHDEIDQLEIITEYVVENDTAGNGTTEYDADGSAEFTIEDVHRSHDNHTDDDDVEHHDNNEVESSGNNKESGVDLARRQLQLLAASRKKIGGKKSMTPTQSSEGSPVAAVAVPSSANSNGAKVIKIDILKPASSGTTTTGSAIPSDLVKSMQSRLSQRIDQIKPGQKLASKPQSQDLNTSGSIEIPKDLIAATDADLEAATYIIRAMETDDATTAAGGHGDADGVADADLLAILEGNDDEQKQQNVDFEGASYVVTAVDDDYIIGMSNNSSPAKLLNPIGVGGGGTSMISPTVVLDKSIEMELALEQMMNLPQKRKGRPPVKGKATTAAAAKKATKTTVSKAKEWVSSLVEVSVVRLHVLFI